MHGSRKYRRGRGGVQAYPPQVYFSHSLNLQRSNGKFFIKKPIISKTPEGVQHFPGGGVQLSGGGGGGNNCLFPLRTQITFIFHGVD